MAINVKTISFTREKCIFVIFLCEESRHDLMKCFDLLRAFRNARKETKVIQSLCYEADFDLLQSKKYSWCYDFLKSGDFSWLTLHF